MRIVLASANFRPHVGGIETFTETLATGLAARGHDVGVICCRYGGAPIREDAGGVSVDRVRSSYVLDRRLNVPYPLPSPAGLLATTRRQLEHADVVHAQDALYATSAPALLLARRRGIASVITQHVAFVPQRTRALDVIEEAALGTIGRCARLATIAAVLNPAVAEWAVRRWGLSDVRILPIGIPPAPPASRDRPELRRSFGLDPARFVAVFVGRNVAKKGLGVFLAAADPAYDLVAVTDRAPAEETEGATVLPFMTSSRLAELLSCVDAFVLPSEGEGFPISMQEALAAGLPVVTTRGPGYEAFLSEDDVLFVGRDPSRVRGALLRLADDQDLCRELSERSRAAATRSFSADRMVTAYEELYEEARERAGSRALSRS